jgi:hypothetical protein
VPRSCHLGHPAPQFERAVEAIEIQRFAPVGPLERTIAREQSVPLRRVVVREIVQRLGDIHQGIAGNCAFEVENARQTQRSVISLSQDVAGMKIVVAEMGRGARIQQVRTLMNDCPQPVAQRGITAALYKLRQLHLELD